MTDLDTHDALVLCGIALHGPVDMTLTSMFWHHEANPLVVHMGLAAWLGFKTALLLAMAAVYYWWLRPEYGPAEAEWPTAVTTALVGFTALGAGVMVTNLTVAL